MRGNQWLLDRHANQTRRLMNACPIHPKWAAMVNLQARIEAKLAARYAFKLHPELREVSL